MGKLTLNLRVNADVMSVSQIHEKLEKGYADIDKGNVVDAASAFEEFICEQDKLK